MMAMAKAPGASAPMWSNDGATGVGSPDGTGAIRAMPCSSIDATLTRTMPSDDGEQRSRDCGDEPADAEEHGERRRRERRPSSS